jgi:hypothetical protein
MNSFSSAVTVGRPREIFLVLFFDGRDDFFAGACFFFLAVVFFGVARADFFLAMVSFKSAGKVFLIRGPPGEP